MTPRCANCQIVQGRKCACRDPHRDYPAMRRVLLWTALFWLAVFAGIALALKGCKP